MHAAHVMRLEAVDDANAGFGGGRVGMRLAPLGLVDGAEGSLPRCALLVGAANGHDAPILVLWLGHKDALVHGLDPLISAWPGNTKAQSTKVMTMPG